MKIIVDAAGGDYYPENPIKGSILALKELDDLDIILTGPEDMIKNELSRHSYDGNNIHIHHAPEIIGMEESPSYAVKKKQHSSINHGLSILAENKGDAFLSAGNTGALLAASTLILGRLDGIKRPTIASYFPTVKGPRLLIDAGATLEVKPDTFLQFAKMGRVYLEQIMNIKNPVVGLLNVGEEPEKGTENYKEAYNVLEQLDYFTGNVEGKDILTGKVDLYLCDGFVGNILLKFGESFPEALISLVNDAMGKMGVAEKQQKQIFGILKSALSDFDHEAVGGLPFLGVDGISMVGHGGSSATAFKNMILNAADCVDNRINDKILATLK